MWNMQGKYFIKLNVNRARQSSNLNGCESTARLLYKKLTGPIEYIDKNYVNTNAQLQKADYTFLGQQKGWLYFFSTNEMAL